MTRTDAAAASRSWTNQANRSADGLCSGRRPLACAARSIGLAMLATAVTLAGPAAILAADNPGSVVLTGEDGKLQATVHTRNGTSQRVVVTAGSSVVLDTNVGITRAEIANPDVAALSVLSPRQILVAGISAGITQVILWDEQENRLLFGIVVEPDLSQLKAAIARTAPGAQVEVHAVKDAVVLRGAVGDVDTSQRILSLAQSVAANVQNHMTVAGEQQVLLRCSVAEVSKRAIRELGVNGWLDVQDDYPKIYANEIRQLDPTTLGPGQSSLLSRRIVFESDLVNGRFGYTGATSDLRTQLFINALEQNQLLRLLAEPNLVALSGQTARFLAGGEFPVPVPQASAGGTAITIEWKEFGVILEFLPTVIGRQIIRLKIMTMVSQVDAQNAVQIEGFFIPGINQRYAQSTVELASGSTIAIAGLLNEAARGVIDKFPWLGEVPVLGTLFRSVEYQQDLTELVVLVTPELVSGMYPDQVPPMPGENMAHPNDWQLYGLGMLEGEPATMDPAREAALVTEPGPHYRKFAGPSDQMMLHGPWGPAEAEETSR